MPDKMVFILKQDPGPTFTKQDKLDPWIKDQLEKYSAVYNFATAFTKFVTWRDSPSHWT